MAADGEKKRPQKTVAHAMNCHYAWQGQPECLSPACKASGL